MWRCVPPPAPSQQADLALREYAVTEGDHVTLLNVYNAFLDNNRSASWCHVNCYSWLLDKPAQHALTLVAVVCIMVAAPGARLQVSHAEQSC